MLDRIDIHIEVPRVDYEKLSDDRLGEPSANVQARVEAARQIQRERFGVGVTHELPIHCNADMRPAQIRQYCK
jgi:magnesium chelatase family protein